MKIIFFTVAIFANSLLLMSQNTQRVELSILPGEYWYGGITSRGFEMPYSSTTVTTMDMWGNNYGNQAQPLLISTKGRYVWSEEPIKYEFNKGTIVVSVREGNIIAGTSGSNLRTAYEFASKTFFSSNGLIPDPKLFTQPQYNTWIELIDFISINIICRCYSA